MSTMFTPATREKLKLRMAICGPAKSGKTFTSLRFAFPLLSEGGRVAVIDTEHGSARKYQGDAPDGFPWEWQNCELQHFAPSAYAAVIEEAGREGFDVLIIDSLSHAWEGKGGALEQVDNNSSGNSFTAWKDVTPQHQGMIAAILSSPCHVITTMRSKMDYVLEPNDKGKMIPRRVGMAPVQRKGMEYEFDIVADMDTDHTLTVGGSRCSAVDGVKANKPGPEFMAPIIRWLNEGTAPAPVPQPQSPLVTTGGGPPAQLTGDPATNGYAGAFCDAYQRNEIIGLAQRLEWPPEALSQIVAKRGVARLGELTYEQAEEVKTRLSELADKSDIPF